MANMLWAAFVLGLMYVCVHTQDCPLQWTARVSNMRLDAENTQLPRRMTEKRCMASCQAYKIFTCVSIEYQKRGKWCRVNSLKKDDLPTRAFKRGRGVVYRERTEVCAGCGWTWDWKVENRALKANADRISAGNRTVESCRERCERFKGGKKFCMAVNYDTKLSKCFLLTLNKSFRKLIAIKKSLYYERVLECPYTDECASEPCQNGGSCYDFLNGYECVCTDQYGGVNCQIKKFIIICTEGKSLVQNGTACPATCVDPDAPLWCNLPNTESCQCEPGRVLLKDRCVLPEACGCDTPAPGPHLNIPETWRNEKCVQFQCLACNDCSLPVGKLIITADGCPPNLECIFDKQTEEYICVGSAVL